MDDRSRIRGFTLIELLIALALTAIVVTQVLLVFVSQLKVSLAQETVLDVQQNARLMMSQVLADTARRAFWFRRSPGSRASTGGRTPPTFYARAIRA